MDEGIIIHEKNVRKATSLDGKADTLGKTAGSAQIFFIINNCYIFLLISRNDILVFILIIYNNKM